MDFPQELLIPQKTLYRKGAALEIAPEALAFGTRGLIVYGRSLDRNGHKERIVKQFPSPQNIRIFCHTGGEPTLNQITQVIEEGKVHDAQWIVGIGGGSILDLAKAAAGLFHAKEKPLFYQEGGSLAVQGIPFIAVPTTAGTGSEATGNSVIINPEKQVKLSIRDKSFLARKVILDVELLRGLPREVLSFAALDALVQGYESFVSKNATWFTESLALKGMELINYHIIAAYEKGKEEDLSSLLLGSYLIGIAFAHSRLGVIHGIAHPLGVLYNFSHGLICSVCFIPSIKLNKNAIEEKYDRLSEIVGGDFIERVETLLSRFNITSPFKGEKIIKKENIIEATLTSGSTAANPKPIVRDDVECLLNGIFK